jgi:fluoroquinolone resistance protein
MKENQVFENYKFNEELNEFSNTTFKNSDFSKFDFNSFEFVDCIFITCDFSMSVFDQIVLTRVKFVNCKMLGIDFGKSSKYLFSVSFEKCILSYCLFLKNNLKKTIFKECIIKEALFSDTDLSLATFIECDLTDTVFENNNLMEADFRTAENYSISPLGNKVSRARFSYPGLLGLLGHFDIVIEE